MSLNPKAFSYSSCSYLITLIAMGVAVFVHYLGDKDFVSRGEPREAIIAQSMHDSGDLVLGRGYGDSVPSKPPMLHWLVLGAAQIGGGINEFTARLPSALGGLLFVLVFFLTLARRYSNEISFLSAMALLLSVEWFRNATICRVDMVFTSFLAGGLIASFLWSEEKQNFKFLVMAALCFTGATLSKGPVSIVLPGIILSLYQLSKGEEFLRIARRLAALFGVPILIAGTWYYLAYSDGREAFLSKFWYENIDRFLGTQHDEPHKHSAFYLWGSLIFGLVPVGIFVLCAAISNWRIILARLKQNKVRESWREFDAFEKFSIIVIGAFLLFFAVPESKRSVYLLPAYPFLCFLSIRYLYSNLSERLLRVILQVWSVVTVVFFAGVLLFTFDTQLIIQSFYLDSYRGELMRFGSDLGEALAAEYKLNFIVMSCLVALSVYFLTSYACKLRRGSLTRGAFVLFSGVYLLLQSAVLPALANMLSPKELIREIEAQLDPGAKLYSFDYEFYAVSFYLDRPMFRLELEPEGQGQVMLFSDDMDRLVAWLPANRVITPVWESNRSVFQVGRHLKIVKISEKEAPQIAALNPRRVHEGYSFQ